MNPIGDPRVLRGMKAQFNTRRERVAAGELPIGWKLGYAAPGTRKKLGITAPLVGFMTDGGLVDSETSVSIANWARPHAEPEIAVYLHKDLPGGSDGNAVRAAISSIGPAFELIDTGNPGDDVDVILSRNISHRKVVLGPRDASRAGGVLDGLSGRLFVNGVEVANTNDLQAANGDMIENVREMADVLANFGEMLRAGQVIITGSVVPLISVRAGEMIVFRLDPIGAVSISL